MIHFYSKIIFNSVSIVTCTNVNKPNEINETYAKSITFFFFILFSKIKKKIIFPMKEKNVCRHCVKRSLYSYQVFYKKTSTKVSLSDSCQSKPFKPFFFLVHLDLRGNFFFFFCFLNQIFCLMNLFLHYGESFCE